MEIRILFGTETGNAEDCASMLGDAIEEAGYGANVTDMDDYQPSDLANETLALIVTSTYGHGDPPYNAEALMAWLDNADSSIAGVPFAVCGLGDRTYPKFGQAGKDFDRLMEERGGRRVLPRVDCDADYEATFKEFQTSVVSWLASNAASLTGSPEAAPAQPAPTATAKTESPLGTRGRPVSATLRSRKRLNNTGSSKETMHYEFSWAGQQVAFLPGDSFAVVPRNNPTEVAAILSTLALHPSESVQVGEETMTLSNALMHTRDLQVVTNDLRAKFSTKSNVPPDPNDHLLDVLRSLPGARLDAQGLVDGLKKIKPRLYSVANSPLVEPEGVHFTVETLRYSHNGRDREGVATTWLADRLSDGDVVDMYCVQAPHFRVPEDANAPTIMIGPGTGVAPFRAFLQHRKAQGASGKNWLFFGHQHQATDYLYQDEFHQYVEDGTLTALSLAWSRDQAHKVYVQDLIAEQGADIWAWIKEGAFIYVCGDKLAMAPAVRATLVRVAVEHGQLSEADAGALLDEWEVNGRYSVDAY